MECKTSEGVEPCAGKGAGGGGESARLGGLTGGFTVTISGFASASLGGISFRFRGITGGLGGVTGGLTGTTPCFCDLPQVSASSSSNSRMISSGTGLVSGRKSQEEMSASATVGTTRLAISLARFKSQEERSSATAAGAATGAGGGALSTSGPSICRTKCHRGPIRLEHLSAGLWESSEMRGRFRVLPSTTWDKTKRNRAFMIERLTTP